MNNRKWVTLAITYVLLVSMVMLGSYVLGYRLLQLPLWEVGIVTGLMIFAGTVGMIIGVILALAKRKK